ncbi:MAG: LuxR C-terminal-related transcriptional regulator [Rhodoplanes sp.]
MPRILVVGEHSLYRMGFCALIKENFTNVEVLETGSITEAVAHIRSDRGVQLVLINLELSRSPSFNLIKSACNNAHDTRLVTISATNNRVDILRSLAAGFSGFISKLQPDHEILASISYVLSGRICVPECLVTIANINIRMITHRQREVLALLTRSTSTKHIALNNFDEAPLNDARPGPDARNEFHQITRRQRDVLALLARGMSNKEIARALGISEATTKIHAAALLRILGVRNRTEAALRASLLINEPSVTSGGPTN